MKLDEELTNLLALPDSEIKDKLRSVIEQHNGKKLNALVKRSKLPYLKTLSQYNFNLQPQIENEIQKLANCEFIDRGEQVLLIGRNGLGKTHMATALAIEALKKGKSVLFTTCYDFITNCEKHKDKVIKKYSKPQLLIFDEAGIQKLNGKSAEYFYKLVSKRTDSKKSIIYTSNISPDEWLEEGINAVASLDRVFSDLHIIKLKVVGESKRKNIISVSE